MVSNLGQGNWYTYGNTLNVEILDSVIYCEKDTPFESSKSTYVPIAIGSPIKLEEGTVAVQSILKPDKSFKVDVFNVALIDYIQPSSVSESYSRDIVVRGKFFTADSVVTMNGAAKPTTYEDEKTLGFQIRSSPFELISPGSYKIQVYKSGIPSVNSKFLTVRSGPPSGGG